MKLCIWKILALLALLCGPLTATHAERVHTMEMADCGNMPAEHGSKFAMSDHCIAGCAIVIPAGHAVSAPAEYAAETFELPAKTLAVLSDEVATPPPK